MKKNMKAYILIDMIFVLTIILAGMIEYGIGLLMDFHYPDWAIYPAAIRGATVMEGYSYYFSQPWYLAIIIISMAALLYIVPATFYPMLCELKSREK